VRPSGAYTVCPAKRPDFQPTLECTGFEPAVIDETLVHQAQWLAF
jgi:hypothetical protein